jgi:hypothetical protein
LKIALFPRPFFFTFPINLSIQRNYSMYPSELQGIVHFTGRRDGTVNYFSVQFLNGLSATNL